MKFAVYLFFALFPIIAALVHDSYVSQGDAFAFTSIGYHIYNYMPPLFNLIKQSFVDSSMRDLVSFLMKTPMAIYSLFITVPATLYVIQCKQQNRGPFRRYLNELPKTHKKWLEKDHLASRFSGGKLHDSDHQHQSGE